MSKNAVGLCRVAVAFGGFNCKELVLKINSLHKDKTRTVNSATVENAMQALYEADQNKRKRTRADREKK